MPHFIAPTPMKSGSRPDAMGRESVMEHGGHGGEAARASRSVGRRGAGPDARSDGTPPRRNMIARRLRPRDPCSRDGWPSFPQSCRFAWRASGVVVGTRHGCSGERRDGVREGLRPLVPERHYRDAAGRRPPVAAESAGAWGGNDPATVWYSPGHGAFSAGRTPPVAAVVDVEATAAQPRRPRDPAGAGAAVGHLRAQAIAGVSRVRPRGRRGGDEDFSR